jgi:hypothetical protein
VFDVNLIAPGLASRFGNDMLYTAFVAEPSSQPMERFAGGSEDEGFARCVEFDCAYTEVDQLMYEESSRCGDDRR